MTPNTERARSALLVLVEDPEARKDFDAEDLVVYTVGMLMSDADGKLAREELVAHLEDPDVTKLATELISEAGL